MKAISFFVLVTCSSTLANSAQEARMHEDVKVYLSFLEAAKTAVNWLEQALESGNATKNKNDVCYLRKFELAAAYALYGLPETRDMLRKVSPNGVITYHILIATEYVDGKRDKIIDFAYIYDQGKFIGFRVDHLPVGWWIIVSPDHSNLLNFSKQGEGCLPYMVDISDPTFLSSYFLL